jgi:endonuclease/exonuclease/phosphatase family metal-dependent hydrolase
MASPRRISVGSLAGGFAVALLLTASASAPLPLGLMTFNIRTASIDDGENAWRNRKTLVVQVIEREAPDVVGLQEVVREQVEYLAAALKDYRWLGVDRGLNGGEGLSEYTPIFYRFAELSPIESGTFWLSPTPDTPSASEPRRERIVTWARFYHRGTGRQFYAFNTHFSPRAGPAHLDASRIIKERIQKLPAGSAIVVLGDFNSSAEESPVWSDLTGELLRDAWTRAPTRRGPLGTMGGFGPPRAGDTERIDWILVGGPIDVQSAETILFNEAGRYPSDHFPVAARVEIR